MTPATVSDTVWVLDTSAIIQIRRLQRVQRTLVCTALTTLVQNGRVCLPPQCYNELERNKLSNGPDLPFDWAHENKTRACGRTPTLSSIREVLAVVPDVLDPDKESGEDEADPYVLALTLELFREGMDARVVTEESKDYATKISMSTAAGMLGIPSTSLLGMLRIEKIL